MQKLTKIEHLDTIGDATRAEYLKKADSIRFRYMRMLASKDEDVSYPVDISAGAGRDPGVHASEAGGCLRALTYGVGGTERKSNGHNVNMLMRFAVGHAVHAMLQHDFHLLCADDKELSFEDEVRINPGRGGAAAQWDIYSSCDGVFTFEDKETGEPYLRVGLEIKTASEKDFDKLHEPKEAHRKQTCVYMKCLDLPLMWTLYYNKSNSNFTEPRAPWLFQFNPKLWRTLEQRISRALSFFDASTLPKREEGFF